MIETLVSEQFEAVVTNAATGLVGTISFQVYDPTDASVIIAETTSGIVEVSPGSYRKFATVSVVGTYHVRWEYTQTSIDHVAEEELFVLTELPAEEEGDEDELDLLTPSVDNVALHLRTRTVGPSSGGLGGDTGPGDITTFTGTTRPTATEVEDMIQAAMDITLGPLGGGDEIPDERQAQVKRAIAIYAAMLVELSFFREQSTAESRATWADLYATALEGVSDAVDDVSGGDGRRPYFGSVGLVSGTRYASDNQVEEDFIPYVD
jgi:hypothetical protein